MRKWYNAVDAQRKIWQEMQRSSAAIKAAGVSQTEFQWTRDQAPGLVNPYAEQDEEDEETDTSTLNTYKSEFSKSEFSIGRNDSSTSLQMRSRTNTGESITPVSVMGRMPPVPPRQFPLGAQAPALQVRTQNPIQQGAAGSPSEHIMDSYFSPTTESPVSTRSSGQLSSQNSMFPFPRQVVPMHNGWNGDDNARFTAPAMPRQQPRDGPSSGYQARNVMRPSLPPNPAASAMAQNRLRSASSPDINNVLGQRRMADPQQPGIPELPPFPAHYAYQPSQLNRANNGSPQSMISATMRASTQSPSSQQQRDRMPPPRSIHLPIHDYQPMQYQQPAISRSMTTVDRSMNMTPGSIDARVMTPASALDQRNRSPPVSSMTPTPGAETAIPTQLKVKVHCPSAGSSFMLVVPTSISYQSLKDRIDAKLQRSTNISLSTGLVKLKYLDEDDYVSIQSDEDVQMAFETWKEQHSDQMMVGQLGEIELFVQ